MIELIGLYIFAFLTVTILVGIFYLVSEINTDSKDWTYIGRASNGKLTSIRITRFTPDGLDVKKLLLKIPAHTVGNQS